MLTRTPAEKWLRGPIGFTVISLLHLAVIYLLAMGLSRATKIEIPGSTVFLIQRPDKPLPPVNPLGEPKLDGRTKVDVPERTLVEDLQETDTESPTVTTTLDTGSAVVQREPVIRPPRIDSRRPLVQPEYPMSAIRQEWQGRILLRLRIGPDGRVLAAEVLTSSGHPVLDQAAVQTALREWRFLPALRDDEPVEGIFSAWVRFDLTDR